MQDAFSINVNNMDGLSITRQTPTTWQKMETNKITQVIQALDNFPMTVEEFLGHQNEVTKRAIKHYRQMCGSYDSAIDSVISEILKAKRRALLAAEVHWFALPAEAGSHISCCFNGTRITGTARIDPKRIKVSLDDGTSKECILLDLAPCIFTDEPFVGSPASEYGQKRAKEMFLDICAEALMQK